MSGSPRSPVFYPGDLRFLAMIAAVATALFLAALLYKLGGFIMKRVITLAVIAAACLVAGCAAGSGLSTLQSGLIAAGMTTQAYCALAPEGRAEIRDRLGLEARLIVCPNDGPPPDPGSSR